MDLSKLYHGGRPKIDWRSGSKKTYDKFHLDNPDINITYSEYEKIIKQINKEYLLYILDTGYNITLPECFGVLFVSKKLKGGLGKTLDGKQYVSLPVDWKETMLQNKLIYHFNSHTDGYTFKWGWTRNRKFKTTEIWQLKVCKKGNQMLSEHLNDKEKSYYQKYTGIVTARKRK